MHKFPHDIHHIQETCKKVLIFAVRLFNSLMVNYYILSLNTAYLVHVLQNYKHESEVVRVCNYP